MTAVPRIVDGARTEDCSAVARLLHDFNTEFDTPSPGPVVLADRLAGLLQRKSTFAVVAGDPPVALALVTLRPNVWFDGPVALLDELYVAPELRGKRIGSALIRAVEAACAERQVALVEVNVDEQDLDAIRFYGRHGYSLVEPTTGERALYISKELG